MGKMLYRLKRMKNYTGVTCLNKGGCYKCVLDEIDENINLDRSADIYLTFTKRLPPILGFGKIETKRLRDEEKKLGCVYASFNNPSGIVGRCSGVRLCWLVPVNNAKERKRFLLNQV